jgi:small-conductance mechanosensitive channel
VSEAWDWLRQAMDFPAVQAGAVAVGALLLARVVDFIITRVLARLVRRTRTDLDDRLIAVLHRPIFISVVLAGLHVATRLLVMPPAFEGPLLSFLVTLAVLVWAGAALRIIHLVLEILGRSSGGVSWVEARTLPLLDNLSKLVVVSVAIYALLVAWNLNVGPLLASAGIVGIALGFAAKDTLANLFGGLSVIADAPYKMGDFIVLDSGERGVVTKIGLRSTRILTRDDVEITIPNAVIANAKITNESGGPSEKHRVTVNIGVAYGSDVDHVRAALMAAAASVEGLSAEPEPRVRFTEFGDSALIFKLLCWIETPASRGFYRDALNTAVYKRLNAEGIQIPFPQRDVHLKGGPPQA